MHTFRLAFLLIGINFGNFWQNPQTYFCFQVLNIWVGNKQKHKRTKTYTHTTHTRHTHTGTNIYLYRITQIALMNHTDEQTPRPHTPTIFFPNTHTLWQSAKAVGIIVRMVRLQCYRLVILRISIFCILNVHKHLWNWVLLLILLFLFTDCGDW